MKNDDAIGAVGPGGYGHRVGKSIAMGCMSTESAVEGVIAQVEISGEFYDAEIGGVPAYDSAGALIRSA